MAHDNDNPKCPLNDPETFAHPATRGLPCTCLSDEADRLNEAQGEPLGCAWPGCDGVHPNATAANPGSQAGWRCAKHASKEGDGTFGLYAMLYQTLARVEALEQAFEAANPPIRGVPEATVKQLAQAALDILVGFRIRAKGSEVQLGDTVVVDDLETAHAVAIIVQAATELECQGLKLMTEFQSPTDRLGAGGIFQAATHEKRR